MQHCKQFGSFIAPAAILISSIHFPSWIISTTITTESLDQSYVSMTLTSNYVLHHVTNENCCSPNIIGTFLMAAVKFISTSTKGSAPWTALVWSQQTIRSMILHLQNYIPVKSNICVETCNASDRTLCRPTNEQCKKPTYTYLYTIYWNSTENNSFDFFEIIFFEIIFFWNYFFEIIFFEIIFSIDVLPFHEFLILEINRSIQFWKAESGKLGIPSRLLTKPIYLSYMISDGDKIHSTNYTLQLKNFIWNLKLLISIPPPWVRY